MHGTAVLTELDAADRLATRGGLLTSVGMTSPPAWRWETVMVPSVFGHKITIGVFGICFPNPLEHDTPESALRERTRAEDEHGHPSDARACALQDICGAGTRLEDAQRTWNQGTCIRPGTR